MTIRDKTPNPIAKVAKVMWRARLALAIILVSAVVFGLWTSWAFQSRVLGHLEIPWSIEGRGLWGDSFGALNALFAALGFIGVLITLAFQQKQIRDAQADGHRQQFEGKFFELLKLMRELRDEVRFRYSPDYLRAFSKADKETLRGQDAFRAAIYEYRLWTKEGDRKGGLSAREAGSIYRFRVHRRYESTFGPFFRIVYTILREIRDDRTLDQAEKSRYGNLLRSQLSSYEIGLAGMNALMKEANDFGELLTEFRMFKYIPPGNRRRFLEKYFAPVAFEPRD